MGEIMLALADNGRVARPGKIYILCKIYVCVLPFSTPLSQTEAQSPKLVTEDITFTSKGVRLAGTMYQPKTPTQNMEIKLYEILGLNVKLKNDESKFSPTMTVKWEEKV